MKRKGQFVSMIAIIALLFISGGSLFTSLFAQETFSQHVNYYSNDMNNIADAKLRGELYPERMEHELNYTFNNVAYKIGRDAGKEDWDNRIPTISQLEDELTSRIWDGEYDIRRQNSILGCSSPNIDSSTFNFDGEHSMSYTLEEPKIRCPLGDPSRAKLPIIKEGANYNSQEYRVNNKKNNYMKMAEYAIELSEKFKEITPDTVEGDGSDTSSCEDSSRSDTVEDAKDEAFGNAFEDFASRAVSQTNTPSFANMPRQKTVFWGRYVGGVESETCTYSETHCSGSGEDRSCTTHTHTSTEYEADYTYKTSSVSGRYTIRDSNNQVPTYAGSQNLEFKFEYKYTLP